MAADDKQRMSQKQSRPFRNLLKLALNAVKADHQQPTPPPTPYTTPTPINKDDEETINEVPTPTFSSSSSCSPSPNPHLHSDQGSSNHPSALPQIKRPKLLLSSAQRKDQETPGSAESKTSQGCRILSDSSSSTGSLFSLESTTDDTASPRRRFKRRKLLIRESSHLLPHLKLVEPAKDSQGEGKLASSDGVMVTSVICS